MRLRGRREKTALQQSFYRYDRVSVAIKDRLSGMGGLSVLHSIEGKIGQDIQRGAEGAGS